MKTEKTKWVKAIGGTDFTQLGHLFTAVGDSAGQILLQHHEEQGTVLEQYFREQYFRE